MLEFAKPFQNGLLTTLIRYRLALCYHGYDLETRQSHKSIGLVAPHAQSTIFPEPTGSMLLFAGLTRSQLV